LHPFLDLLRVLTPRSLSIGEVTREYRGHTFADHAINQMSARAMRHFRPSRISPNAHQMMVFMKNQSSQVPLDESGHALLSSRIYHHQIVRGPVADPAIPVS